MATVDMGSVLHCTAVNHKDFLHARDGFEPQNAAAGTPT